MDSIEGPLVLWEECYTETGSWREDVTPTPFPLAIGSLLFMLRLFFFSFVLCLGRLENTGRTASFAVMGFGFDLLDRPSFHLD